MKEIVFIVIIAALTISPVAFAIGDKTAGEIIFKRNCAGCHGDTGEGNGPAASSLKPKPANFISSDYRDSIDKNLATYSDTELEEIIANGRRGTAMPAWKKGLNAHQISDVLAYIRSLHK